MVLGRNQSCQLRCGGPNSARSRPPSDPSIEWILRDVSFTIAPQRNRRHRRPHRSRQDHHHRPHDALLRHPGREISSSTASTSANRTLTKLRQRFGVVLQDPFLFSGTIADNIRLGTKSITEDRSRTRRRRGQRRRLHPHPPPRFRRASPRARSRPLHRPKAAHQLRRALAHDPGILILDEATSSVDTETEIRVRLALSAHDHRPHQRPHRASPVEQSSPPRPSSSCTKASCASKEPTSSF